MERGTSVRGGDPSIPDVSIIIVNWNLKGLLRSCLESITSFKGGCRVETIVVDNASSDGSPDMVVSEFREVTLIRNSTNVGFSRANNQAIEFARGRYIFLLNNDALLFEGSLPRLVEFMDDHPDAGACGPRVINEDGSLQSRSKGRYPSIATAAAHFFLPRSWQQRPGSKPAGFYEYRDEMRIKAVEWVSGCALLARRKAVEQVGPLDAEVFMYCEDVDWCYRMNHAGWGIYYVPASEVMHYGGMSMKKQRGRVVGAHKAGLIAFYTKYHGRRAGVIFRAVLWAGYALRASGWLVQAILGRRAGLDKLRRSLPTRSHHR